MFTSPRGGRTEQGYCSVSYVAYDSNSFRISNTIPSTSAAIAQIGEDSTCSVMVAVTVGCSGDSCTQDWVTIAGGGATAGAVTNVDRCFRLSI